MANAKLFFEIIFYLVSTIVVSISIFTYRRSIRIKKAEWLSTLSEKFYQNNYYRNIRRILDYPENSEDFENLKLIVQKLVKNQNEFSPDEISLLENFADFLNFYEFIGSLEKLGQLNYEEITLMFEYYLKLMGHYNWILIYLKHDGFDLTLGLIKRIKEDN